MGCSCSSLNEPPEDLGEAPQLALLGNKPSPDAVNLVMKCPIRPYHQTTGDYFVYSQNDTLMYKVLRKDWSAHGTRMVYDGNDQAIMMIQAEVITTYRHSITGYTVVKGKKGKWEKNKRLFKATMKHKIKYNSVEMHFENTGSSAKGKLTYINRLFTRDDPMRFVPKGKGAQSINVGSIAGTFGNMSSGETWNMRCARGMDPFLVVCVGVSIEEMARQIYKAQQQRLQNQMNRNNM